MTLKPKKKKNSEENLVGERIDPLRLMAQLPLHPYQVLADYHCGTGHFTIPIAKHVFDGKVYAVDPNVENLEELKKSLSDYRLTNVVVSKQGDISPSSLDGALLAFALHKMKNKKAILKETLETLKKGSWLAVLEWNDKVIGEGPPASARIGDSEVVELARGIGFRFSEKRILGDQHYLLMLRK
ncbi:methyltransferase domain-containing protein [SAR202 cluster bacterium AD-802-E10_MRT_200m]|nr:methyltransferase domain-containing protein [SAR202 cluster bacterium AD-802-E10_MRT_200m]